MSGIEYDIYVIQYHDPITGKIYYLSDTSCEKGIGVVDNLGAATKMHKLAAGFEFEKILFHLERGEHFVIDNGDEIRHKYENIYCNDFTFYNNSKILKVHVTYEIVGER